MPNHLLFQAYTPLQVAGCRYFLLKYLSLYNLKPPAQTGVIIYTNQPVAFEGFTNFFPQFQMPDVLLNAPGGGLTQAAVLQQALLQHSGNMLYCDAGTYPLQPLEPLFADIEKGALYLHEPCQEKERKRAVKTPSRRNRPTTVAAPPNSVNLWQAGVAGINSRKSDLILKLREAENAQPGLAADALFTKTFGAAGKIKIAAKYIFSYSELPEFGALLETFFKKTEEESIPNQVKLAHHLDAAAVQKQKEAYRQQPLFKRWLQIITGKRWSVTQYEKRW